MIRAAAAGLCAATALALGCGGEDEGPSRAEFRASANAICATAEGRTAPLVRQLAIAARSLSAERASEAAVLARRLEETSGRYVAELRRLERPSADDEQIDAFLVPAERLVAQLGRAADALERRDVIAAAGVVQESRRLAADAQAAAGRYGLEACRSFAALVPA